MAEVNAIVAPLCFVGPLNVEVVQEITHWIWTHKMFIGLRWVAISFLLTAAWAALRWIQKEGWRDDDDID